MSVGTPHVILIGNVPTLDVDRGPYRIYTIEESTDKQDIDRDIRQRNPLLIIKVISNRSADEATRDLQEALALSYPVVGLHLLEPEAPNLIITESCDVNQLDNLIVCNPATHNVTEIVQWAMKNLIPHLADQRLLTLSEKPSLKEQLLRKPDPRPELKKLTAKSQPQPEQEIPRAVKITSISRRIWGKLVSTTASRINIEAKAGDGKLDVATEVQITDEDIPQSTFVLGRIENKYTLAQTVPPVLLRRGSRMPYTTKVTIATGEMEYGVLGYDLSSSGISVHKPNDLELEIGTEVFVTTELQAELRKQVEQKTFDFNFELRRESGYVTRAAWQKFLTGSQVSKPDDLSC